jgi:hypothetical protein
VPMESVKLVHLVALEIHLALPAPLANSKRGEVLWHARTAPRGFFPNKVQMAVQLASLASTAWRNKVQMKQWVVPIARKVNGPRQEPSCRLIYVPHVLKEDGAKQLDDRTTLSACLAGPVNFRRNMVQQQTRLVSPVLRANSVPMSEKKPTLVLLVLQVFFKNYKDNRFVFHGKKITISNSF